MLYVGLDVSRKRIDFHAVDVDGGLVERGAVPADRDGLARLVLLLGGLDREVVAVVESMNGARFVHDQLELAGWEVEIADAQRVKGLAPLACKTDRIDAWVLAELARRDLVPALWLPDPAVRGERERARFRLHWCSQRTALKNRVHATLIAHGHACPVSDLFGLKGRALLSRGWRSPSRGGHTGGEPAPDRRARARDRRDRAGAAPPGRRPPLRATLDQHPRCGLGAGLHDRRRDRRHRALRPPAQAGRLQRPLPQGRAVR